MSAIPKSVSRRVNFYSNGVLTVLGPKGWACTSLFAANGSENLVAYPPGQVDPTSANVPANALGVIAEADYVGHGPGVGLVCRLFPNSPAVRTFSDLLSSLPCSPAAKETVDRPTPDVAIFHDAPHVKGTGELSGGPNAVSGVILFPQNDPTSVGNVSKETCALPNRDADLCHAIVNDFVVRSFPSEVPPR